MNIRACAIVALVLTAPCAVAENEQQKTAAEQSAVQWLALVDRGDYASSWNAAAKIFRSQISSAGWAEMAASVRNPLGAMVERRLLSASYATHLSGAPDGEYVVLRFETHFANKANAIETVTPMLDAGEWRVSGYYIR